MNNPSILFTSLAPVSMNDGVSQEEFRELVNSLIESLFKSEDVPEPIRQIMGSVANNFALDQILNGSVGAETAESANIVTNSLETILKENINQNKEEDNMATREENIQQEEVINPIVRYIRQTENIPTLNPVEVDRDNWEIKNSKNYKEIDPDWKEKFEDRSIGNILKPSLCTRCGKAIINDYYHRRYSTIKTLCDSCLEDDKQRLVNAFLEEWRDKRFTLTKRGKQARMSRVFASNSHTRLPEDFKIDFTMTYCGSGIACNNEYTIDDIYEIWEIEGIE